MHKVTAGVLRWRPIRGRPCAPWAEDGQSLAEYGLVIMLVGIVVLVLVATVGKQASNLFSNVSSGIGN